MISWNSIRYEINLDEVFWFTIKISVWFFMLMDMCKIDVVICIYGKDTRKVSAQSGNRSQWKKNERIWTRKKIDSNRRYRLAMTHSLFSFICCIPIFSTDTVRWTSNVLYRLLSKVSINDKKCALFCFSYCCFFSNDRNENVLFLYY